MASTAELQGRRLGRVLTKMGKITRDQAQEALELQKQKRAPVGQLLVELGYCSHDDVNFALAAQAGMKVVDLEELEIKEEVIKMVPAEMANAYHVLPIRSRCRVQHADGGAQVGGQLPGAGRPAVC